MKDLVGRARATTNLVGLFSVLMAWLLFSPYEDIIGSGFRLLESAESLSEETLSHLPELQKLTASYGEPASPRSAASPATIQRRILAVASTRIDVVAAVAHKWGTDREEVEVVSHLVASDKIDDLLWNHNIDSGELNQEIEAGAEEEQAYVNHTYELAERLYALIEPLELPPGSTLAAAHEEINPKIVVPILGLKVPHDNAFYLLCLGSGLSLLYLISVVQSIDRGVRATNRNDCLDWVFFHTAPLGSVLGCVWVLTPATLSLIAARVPYVPTAYASAAGLALSLLGALVVNSALKGRVKLHRSFDRTRPAHRRKVSRGPRVFAKRRRLTKRLSGRNRRSY